MSVVTDLPDALDAWLLRSQGSESDKHRHCARARAACATTRGLDCHTAVIQAPFGLVALRTRAGRLTGIDFLPPGWPLKPPETELARQAARQLMAYFRDPTTVFDLPVELVGSSFRQCVWRAVQAIPCGQTRTYGELAALLHSAPRAVGQAVGDNPLPIIVPCHRVVGKRGLGGFDHATEGDRIAIKRWLLRHEGRLGE